ncbi:MAG: SpoIIE family protein phosphatase, partial [Bacteroidales bacterium]|nr:SpoIIE family protein phosphatase [Bacteroidales bacterium]
MNLSDKLSLYVMYVSIGVFIAIILIVEFYAAKSESEQAEHITRLLQTEMVSNLDSRFYAVEQNVKRTVPEARLLDIAQIKQHTGDILKILLESDSIIEGCGIAMIPEATPTGREWMEYLCRDKDTVTLKQLGETDYNYTSCEWYRTPLNLGEGAWSKPYEDKGAGECLMVTYALPVVNASGETTCEVTADIAISMLDEELHRLIPYPGSYSFILTKDGEFLEGYPQVQQDFPSFASAFQTGKTVTMNGTEFICTFTPVESINIVVGTASPRHSVASVTSRIRLPLLLILVIGFILLIAVVRMTLVRAMQPLKRLTQSAIDIGNGDFDIVIPETRRYADLSRLGEAMSFMKDSINRYIAEIKENTRAREQMESQLRIARDIQRSLLPAPEATFTSKRLRLSAFQESALEVGGDLYDYVDTDKSLYFIIADVSGKGIPAALMMSYVKSLFHFAAQQKLQPSEIVARINDNMCADNPNNMFVTLQVGYIDTAAEKLVISNAGHNPAILRSALGCSYLNLPAALAVGILPNFPYTQQEIPFVAGDTLFMYTDGLSEAENPQKVFYGQERLLQTVTTAISTQPSTTAIVASIGDEIKKYSANNYSDDITMLCLSAFPNDGISMQLRYDVAEL